MKKNLQKVIFFICISSGITVILERQDKLNEPDFQADNYNKKFSQEFGNCLADKVHGTFECFNRGSLSVLQSLNDIDHLDFGNIKMDRSDSIDERNLLDLDYDPQDFGNVVKAAGRLVERRNFQWDLSNIYPGLLMHVGPMINGNGVLEFILDEKAAKYTDRRIGMGRMLMRNLVLPFLLGFNFSLSSLIPLIFGILLLVTKKALIITKIAFVLNAIFGWNSIGTIPSFEDTGNINNLGNPNIGFGQNHNYYGSNGNNNPNYNQFAYGPYKLERNPSIDGYNNQHIIREILNVYEPTNNHGHQKVDSSRSGKNFIWSASA
ncbi:uncharacterized protein LOC122859515 [Aphidius gifuensis]|uniref:uncharacterized protein LOC122859515 n=1 Tax=Aphidius gifuensis TaxID=684658 RepID=UPI001CDC1314|nr:uncharacterized protein LOC122859515 [Aphidius gifuensis]